MTEERRVVRQRGLWFEEFEVGTEVEVVQIQGATALVYR